MLFSHIHKLITLNFKRSAAAGEESREQNFQSPSNMMLSQNMQILMLDASGGKTRDWD